MPSGRPGPARAPRCAGGKRGVPILTLSHSPGSWLSWSCGAIILVLCLGWLLTFSRLAWNLAHLRDLAQGPRVAPATWPRVSVVIAGRDEARALQQTLRSLLAQDYPDFKIIFVDDRSSDGSSAMARRLARDDPRLVPLRIEHLPAGWLGKPHALARGFEEADGEWILFADADVRFAPDTLSLAVGMAVHENVDHLTAFPDLLGGTFWLRVVAGTFGAHLLAGLRFRKLREPRSSHSVGVGAFNLVRRSLLARTPGFSWLRMEVADDLGLAQMVKDAGGRALAVSGHGQVSLAWYENAAGMIRGLEKNTYGAVACYRPARALLMALAMAAYALAPLAAWCPGLPAGMPLAGAAALLAPSLCALLGRHRFGLEWAPALFTPVGLLILAWALVRSALHCRRRRGIIWRGTFYPVAELRRGQRVRIWGTTRRVGGRPRLPEGERP